MTEAAGPPGPGSAGSGSAGSEPVPEPVSEPIAIVGMAGVGKSAVAIRLASRLHRRFVDLDQLVSERVGRPVEEIFRSAGEAAFREAERDALLTLLRDGDPAVIATGGGVVVRADNRADLVAGARCVWLDASREELIARLSLSPGRRPLIGEDIGASVDALVAQRTAWYAEVAAVRVDTTGAGISDVVDRVLSALS